MFPLTPELRAVLERQRDLMEVLQRKQGRIIPWIFHDRGEPIRQIQKNWDKATLAAGLRDAVSAIMAVSTGDTPWTHERESRPNHRCWRTSRG